MSANTNGNTPVAPPANARGLNIICVLRMCVDIQTIEGAGHAHFRKLMQLPAAPEVGTYIDRSTAHWRVAASHPVMNVHQDIISKPIVLHVYLDALDLNEALYNAKHGIELEEAQECEPGRLYFHECLRALKGEGWTYEGGHWQDPGEQGPVHENDFLVAE